MKTIIRRIVTLVLCVTVAAAASLSAAALTAAEKQEINNKIAGYREENKKLQQEIDSIKADKSKQATVLSSIRRKISNTQAIIDAYNSQIGGINKKIADNKAKIKENEKSIAKDKEDFKKRLRAIYMTSSDSNLKILLGAEDFSNFLQLSQLTSAVSSRDKKIIEDLTEEIKKINEKIKENEELLREQIELKSVIDEQQNELESQENEAQKIYNNIASDQKNTEAQVSKNEAEIRKLQKQLEDKIASGSYNSFVNSNTGLQWPVSGFYNISSHYGWRWGRMHNGTDIAGGAIQGQPIRAMADGYVTLVSNSCSHNYKKYGNCCGNGYGNYCVVNHGSLSINGSSANYVAYYAHASRIVVSNGQYVKQGQTLGYVGTTGWSTGYHLHFGILKNGAWINPYPLFF